MWVTWALGREMEREICVYGMCPNYIRQVFSPGMRIPRKEAIFLYNCIVPFLLSDATGWNHTSPTRRAHAVQREKTLSENNEMMGLIAALHTARSLDVLTSELKMSPGRLSSSHDYRTVCCQRSSLQHLSACVVLRLIGIFSWLMSVFSLPCIQPVVSMSLI
jgi:hypothetical protein